ncbi:signal recognition particle, SRP9/SRP14 subunit [Aspergillus egyptiacus]|nr:signal recognition particle, SRP9/SRP14 subunit [Aspergillus egyptiacus]
MPQPMSHEEFFTSLTNLLTTTSQNTKGSVYLTQKPLLNTSSESAPTSQPAILIRATDGNTSAPNPKTHPELKDKKRVKESKVKISTVVQPQELEPFYARYADICKAGMTGLKKRDRKQKKAKAKGGAGKVSKA